MIPSIDSNSESVHEYRGQIYQAIERLKEQYRKTNTAIERVGETWDDPSFRQFKDNFNQDKEEITKLCDILDEYESNILYSFEEKLRTLEEHQFRRI